MPKKRNKVANALSFDTVEDSQTYGDKAVDTGDYGHCRREHVVSSK